MARPTKSGGNRPPFAQRLETVRKRTGLSQKDFATALGLEAETYRRYERDGVEPKIETLAAIRRITGINLNFLIAGEPDLVVNLPDRESQKVKTR